MSEKAYNHQEIEQKWRKYWETTNLYKTPEIEIGDKKKYILFAFAYPSGSGLHVGHAKPYSAVDIIARYSRLTGNKVLCPTGWDAFGLPAENFAIKNGVHPRISTDDAIRNYQSQVKMLGMSSDWSDEIATHRPEYYKWTQWFFQLLYKKGLAYKKEAVVNWDPVDQTVLANEQVLPDGTGERSGAKVEQRLMSQWFFKITDYIEDKEITEGENKGKIRKGLLNGLTDLQWPESTKMQQRNWIGKSVGINITYKIEESNTEITVYTTRPDTNFGATFIVVAPDSSWVKDNFESFKYQNECEQYINKTKQKTELERISEGKVKTGEFTGLHAVNSLNGQKMPIYLSDFVLSRVGTGAVVGVPGSDQRDFDFAKNKHLPIIRVVVGEDGDTSEIIHKEQVQESQGTMINSEFLDGLQIMEAKEKIKDYLEEKGFGKRITNYRLRDWSVTRQRYWGSPTPIYYDSEGKEHLVPESDLPVILPDDVEFLPTGRSPLIDHKAFHASAVEKYGAGASRESDTIDTFVCSSWYFFRFVDAHNQEAFASKESMQKWLPVDEYIIGAEHTVLHLLYSRFLTKVLFDEGYINFDEPFTKMTHQGMVLGTDNRKMSKRWGNVVNPTDVINEFGADTLRMYEMFMGPFKDSIPWSDSTVKGVRRFLNKVWKLQDRIYYYNQEIISKLDSKKTTYGPKTERIIQTALNKLINKIGKDITEFSFNTAVSEYMKFVNLVEDTGAITNTQLKDFLIVLHPFAPFISEEIYSTLPEIENKKHSLQLELWPKENLDLVIEEEITFVVQVNGKVRGTFQIEVGSSDEIILNKAKEIASKHVEGKNIKFSKIIPNKLVTLVVD